MLDELVKLLVGALVVDDELLQIRREEVARGAQHQVGLFVKQVGRLDAVELLEHVTPERHEQLHIALEFVIIDALADGADDEARALWAATVHDFLEATTLAIRCDAARDADVRDRRHEDGVATGDGDLAGQARALGSHGLLGDLDDDLLTFLEDVLDVNAAAVRLLVA